MCMDRESGTRSLGQTEARARLSCWAKSHIYLLKKKNFRFLLSLSLSCFLSPFLFFVKSNPLFILSNPPPLISLSLSLSLSQLRWIHFPFSLLPIRADLHWIRCLWHQRTNHELQTQAQLSLTSILRGNRTHTTHTRLLSYRPCLYLLKTRIFTL